MPNDALREYIEKSEKRVIIDGVFNARMSKDIAKSFDAGLYDVKLNDHKKCVNELKTINIKYPENTNPVFYIYIIPDETSVELLRYPYKDHKKIGKPVNSYDSDGFSLAYGSSQNFLIDNGPISTESHVNLIHEYAHLIYNQFGVGRDRWFAEGFAELVPWYVLEYENRVPKHLVTMKSLDKIYTVNELLDPVVFSDAIPGERCAYQPSYISAYLAVRAIVEHIRVKYKLSRFEAVQKVLELVYNIKCRQQWFVRDLTQAIDMDMEKLLNSTEYQIATLNQIEHETKKNIIIGTRERN